MHSPLSLIFSWSRAVFSRHIIGEFLKSINGNMPEHVHIPYSMHLTYICAISHIDQNMKLGQWFQSSSAWQSVN